MKTTLILADELLEKLDEIAQAYGISRSDVIRFAIKGLLERLGVIKPETAPLELRSPKQQKRGD